MSYGSFAPSRRPQLYYPLTPDDPRDVPAPVGFMPGMVAGAAQGARQGNPGEALGAALTGGLMGAINRKMGAAAFRGRTSVRLMTCSPSASGPKSPSTSRCSRP